MNQASDTLVAERILGLPTYDWEVAAIGDEAPVFGYAVTRESIAAYCEAVRNDNALYLDEAAAKSGWTVARSWSHEFENVREDRWAGVVATDTRVRSQFYDPPSAIASPLQPSVARSAHHLE